MSFLFSLALRNLTRNLKRSLLTSVAAIAGVALMVLGFGMVDGLDENVIRTGIDTLVTGDLREEWFTVAQEHRLNLYLCGHYATEVHGVQALAADVAQRFGLPWRFIPSDNPL